MHFFAHPQFPRGQKAKNASNLRKALRKHFYAGYSRLLRSALVRSVKWLYNWLKNSRHFFKPSELTNRQSRSCLLCTRFPVSPRFSNYMYLLWALIGSWCCRSLFRLARLISCHAHYPKARFNIGATAVPNQRLHGTFETKSSHWSIARQALPRYTAAVARLSFKRRTTDVSSLIHNCWLIRKTLVNVRFWNSH